MAAKVDYLADVYETSQVVSFNGLKTLFENKETKYPPTFYSTRDPKPVKFQLIVTFGAEDDQYLSVYVVNRSKRKVDTKKITFTLKHFHSGILKEESFEGEMFDSDTDANRESAWCFDLYKVNDLRVTEDPPTVGWQIQITCKILYEGTLEQKVVTEAEKNWKEKGSQLADDLLDILLNEKDTDISFEIDGQVIKAHRLFLSARSEYFRSMFNSGMIENSSNKVKIKECDPTMFKKLLEFLYTDKCPTDIDAIASKLLPVADQYMISALKSYCADALRQSLTQDNVKEVLLLAHIHNCPLLKEYCFQHLTFSFFNDSEMKDHADLALEYLQFLSNRADN